MNIAQVQTGIFPIPPKGYGAVEKIIWEYKCNLEKKGHTCDALYLNEIDHNKYDIIHVHLANLALELKAKNIPYYFTCHDHHAYLYGKDSFCFKQNYEAIKNSILSFVPAKYLVKYFDLPNLKYLSHGVNNELYKKSDILHQNHKLLCLANNGFIHNQSEDRKGFGLAIEAAKLLNLPITVAGPKNNLNFFEKHNFNYDKLTILYDINEQDLVSLYQNHTIFLHPSILEAGHPNLTLLEAIGCQLPIVGTFEEENELHGLFKVTRSVKEVVDGICHVINNYDFYKKECLITKEKKSWDNITSELYNFYLEKKSMKSQLLKIYNETCINPIPSVEYQNKIIYSFTNECKVEILGDVYKKYNVSFIDKKLNKSIYDANITNNMWCSPSIKYYTDWNIKVQEVDSNQILNFNLDLKHKKIKIINESPSLGDFLAWMPFIDLFQKKHNCDLDFYTPHIDLVKESYNNINFYNYNYKNDQTYYAIYKIGYFEPSDRNMSPNDPRTITLQQIASDILGLEYCEIKSKLALPKNLKNNFNKKYVCIGSLSTSQAKFWNNDGGWNKVVEYLNNLGYDVVSIDKHNNIGSHEYKNSIPSNSIDKTGNLPLEERINDLYFCDFFIGLGSGLSWLAWSVGKPVVLISGFSDPISEFSTPYRVHNKNVCNSCWNDTDFKFDPSKWDWCPRNKDFECSSKITFEMVKEKIDQCILDISK
jgi:autotransporter strand-loop-strand O-heptosyltransferase